MIKELNEENFDSETDKGLKLIEFYATWCMYCKKQRIEFESLEKSDMWIGIVDGDESPELVGRYQIKAFPSFILLKDGQIIAEFSGFHTKGQLLSKLMKYV